MPRELTAAEEASYARYMALGTPEEIQGQIKKLRTESAKYRTRAAELEEAAKGAPAVPEGGKVLTKTEAESFAAFEALKVKPDQIEALTKERDELKESLAKRDRESARDAAARTIGIEGKDLTFAGADALEYLVKEEEVEANGKKEKKPVAYVKDADGKEHTLADYGKATWGRGFEALVSAPAQQPKGTPYPHMTGGAGSPSGPPDPAEVGKRMAEDSKKAASDQSLAFR